MSKRNYSIRTLYLAQYNDGMYPEDNEVFGAYQTYDEAKERTVQECQTKKNQFGPNSERNTTKIRHYSVTDVDYMVPTGRLSAEEGSLLDRLSESLGAHDREALLNLIDRLLVHEDPED